MIDLAEATEWIDRQLASDGTARRGPVERFRSRPWGEVLRAETERGTVWLKAPKGATAFETELYAILADADPGAILEPIGLDSERGWVLLPDGGRPLGERLEGDELVRGMTSGLERYGELQVELSPRVEEMLAAGVADMRPAAMAARFEEALEAGARYARASDDPADSRSLERVVAYRDRYRDLCRELAERPGGASLDHNDLHPWNMLGENGSVRFYDWGDSVVAHPFASALVPLGFMETIRPGSASTARAAYLSAFDTLGSPAELVETLELACRVAKVARALTWERALLAGDEASADPDFRRAPLESLESLLDESYLGRT